MRIIYFIVILFFVACDQISKSYMIDLLNSNEKVIQITNNLRLIEAWNPGISFGLFSQLKYGYMLFSIISLAISTILSYFLIKSKSDVLSLGCSFIIGGAIGNTIDRIRYEAVYDFIEIYVGILHWPVFNIADIFITMGTFILMMKWYVYDGFISKKT